MSFELTKLPGEFFFKPSHVQNLSILGRFGLLSKDTEKKESIYRRVLFIYYLELQNMRNKQVKIVVIEMMVSKKSLNANEVLYVSILYIRLKIYFINLCFFKKTTNRLLSYQFNEAKKYSATTNVESSHCILSV